MKALAISPRQKSSDTSKIKRTYDQGPSIIPVSNRHRNRFLTFQQEADNCWNDIVSLVKYYYAETRKWIARGDLQKELKGSIQYRVCPSHRA